MTQACRSMDHLSMLAQLAPADRRTARMLMRNFSSNLRVRCLCLTARGDKVTLPGNGEVSFWQLKDAELLPSPAIGCFLRSVQKCT